MQKTETEQMMDYVRKARFDLLAAYNRCEVAGEPMKAKFISNAINQLDALIHIENITKKEVKA